MVLAEEVGLTLRSWNRSYYKDIEKFCCTAVPPHSSVLMMGCRDGKLLHALRPKRGLGIDPDEELIMEARSNFPELEFRVEDQGCLDTEEKFEYVILPNSIGYLKDIWKTLRNLRKVAHLDTRIVIIYYNCLWEPILKLGELLKLKSKSSGLTWLMVKDLENLLHLNDFEAIRMGYRFFFPLDIPIISTFINDFLFRLPLINRLCLIEYVIARCQSVVSDHSIKYSCSVIVPCRNEAHSIEKLIENMPELGSHTEIIFVDGASNDGTVEEIERMMKRFEGSKDIKLIHQGKPVGKGDAVRKGFDRATGDLLMILDSDLSVEPYDLFKFYLACAEGKGELIIGSRFIYPMEEQAMRFINFLGNKLFSLFFSWLLGQHIGDTLCGTKALFKKDYLRIRDRAGFFSTIDPFGDFELILGAAKMALKIIEIPVRYQERTYGRSKTRVLKHGSLLVRMCIIGMKEIKFS